MAGLPNHVIDAVSKAIRSSLDKFDNINFNLHTRLIKDIEHVATSGESHLVVSCFPGEKPETLTFHPLMEHVRGAYIAVVPIHLLNTLMRFHRILILKTILRLG